jgi:tetratricopeptide (TPR) repeat protein
MKFFRLILLGLSSLLLIFRSGAETETMTQRELKQLLERQRAVLGSDLNPSGDRIKDSAVQTQLVQIVREYEGLLERDPGFVPTYVAYGQFLNLGGESKRANEVFRKADKLDPTLGVVKNQLGNYQAEEGDFEEAFALYDAAIRLEPKEALYHYQIARLLYEYRDEFVKSGRWTRDAVLARSADEFGLAARLAPDNFAFAYRYAESYYDRTSPDWPAALAAWQALEPRTKPGVELQTLQLHEANVLLRLGRNAEARKLIDGVTDPALQANRQTLVARLPATGEKAP